jgi:hypothetical protein
MLEKLLKVGEDLLAAIVALTAALAGANLKPGAADDLDDPVPDKKPASKPAADKTGGKKTEKTEKVTLDDIRDYLRNERERLKTDVSVEAVAAQKQRTQECLKTHGATSVTDIDPKKAASFLKAIRDADEAANEDSGDGSDDDL